MNNNLNSKTEDELQDMLDNINEKIDDLKSQKQNMDTRYALRILYRKGDTVHAKLQERKNPSLFRRCFGRHCKRKGGAKTMRKSKRRSGKSRKARR